MVETGKRYRSQRDHGGDNHKNQKRRAPETHSSRDEKGNNDDLVVYRILCPDRFIGSVIGKSGSVINSIRQDSKAKIRIVDPFPGAKERVITIYCYVRDKDEVEIDEEFNDRHPLCPAQDALLKVHAAIANALSLVGDSDQKRSRDKREECQILVPSSQSANLIGKSGATIKKLRHKTKTNIKINAKDAGDPTHSCAMDFDNFVSISGDSEAVKRALFAVSSIMYKFAPKEEISLETAIPETRPSIIIPSDVPIYPTGGMYQSVEHVLPSRSVPSVVSEVPGYADTGSTWPVYSSAIPMVSGFGGASRSEELIIRVLCPANRLGRVIGKGGSSIKSLRQTSGARVDVDDAKSDRDECVISITSTESPDDLKSMAVEAVLLLQEKINDEDDDNVNIRLLVPSKVIGCIIGKSGSIINEIRKRTKADVRISKGKKPKSVDTNDELVEVVGEIGSVRDALVQIVLRLRDDVLKDRESGRNTSAGVDSLYTGGTTLSMPSVLSSVTPMGYEQRAETGSGLGLLSSSSFYGYGSLPVADNGYGSMASYSSNLYGGYPPPSTSTLEIVVPSYAVGKVMGKGGANLANLRNISGAVIEISDSKSSRGDRVALISGTPEQKRAAENLIQAFIMAT